ncbi:MAG TPA: AraC family transcriptional regulator [Caproiciproducens sp.]|nr:AraC family transcriptional regulator [Caproiciproducens sp.]
MMENAALIQKITDYIENHLSEELDLDRVADIAGYSKFHLNRIFSEITGCTIHRYIQRRRLTESARQLIFTEKSIVEIAFAAGYESQQSYSLAFRNLYCNSPQEFRKKREFRPVQLAYSGKLQIRRHHSAVTMKCGVKAA